MKVCKNQRILYLYSQLTEGKCINPFQVASEFSVDIRTIKRDLADINAYLANEMVEKGIKRMVVYDRTKKVYLIA